MTEVNKSITSDRHSWTVTEKSLLMSRDRSLFWNQSCAVMVSSQARQTEVRFLKTSPAGAGLACHMDIVKRTVALNNTCSSSLSGRRWIWLEWMNEWMNESMNERMNERTIESINISIDRSIEQSINQSINKYIKWWIKNEQSNKNDRTNDRINKWIKEPSNDRRSYEGRNQVDKRP